MSADGRECECGVTLLSCLQAAVCRMAGFGEIPVLSEHAAPTAGPMRSEPLSDPESAGLLRGELQMKSGHLSALICTLSLTAFRRGGGGNTAVICVSENGFHISTKCYMWECITNAYFYIQNRCLQIRIEKLSRLFRNVEVVSYVPWMCDTLNSFAAIAI